MHVNIYIYACEHVYMNVCMHAYIHECMSTLFYAHAYEYLIELP